HGRDSRTHRLAPGARLEPRPGRGGDRRPAADGSVHDRVPDRHNDVLASAGAGDHPRPRAAGRTRCTAPAPERPRVRRSRRAQRAVEGIVPTRRSASRARARGRSLAAAGARLVVPIRGEPPELMNWPSVPVDARAWSAMADRLQSGEVSLLGLWGEPGLAHMAILEAGRPSLLHLRCSDNRFPSVGRVHPPAIRLERAMRDLYGLEAEGAPDTRPWLRHGAPYAFLPAEGEGLHQIPVGPVHAGIIEPGHFRFTANGETVVRLEQRLGYVHKGIASLMAGAPLERAATLAARVSGDSTVAHALAFARAVEDALGIEVPPRAAWLRALAGELERLANHFGDIGAVCNDAAFSIMHASCCWLREQVLRAANECFGHRLMMDSVVPGGMRRDLAAGGAKQVAALVALARERFPELEQLYDNTASLK